MRVTVEWLFQARRRIISWCYQHVRREAEVTDGGESRLETITHTSTAGTSHNAQSTAKSGQCIVYVYVCVFSVSLMYHRNCSLRSILFYVFFFYIVYTSILHLFSLFFFLLLCSQEWYLPSPHKVYQNEFTWCHKLAVWFASKYMQFEILKGRCFLFSGWVAEGGRGCIKWEWRG